MQQGEPENLILVLSFIALNTLDGDGTVRRKVDMKEIS